MLSCPKLWGALSHCSSVPDSAGTPKLCACNEGALSWLACHSSHVGYHRTKVQGSDAARVGFCGLSRSFLLSCLFFLRWVSTTIKLLRISWFYGFVVIAEPDSLYLPLSSSFLVALVCYLDQTQNFSTYFRKAWDPHQIFFFLILTVIVYMIWWV